MEVCREEPCTGTPGDRGVAAVGLGWRATALLLDSNLGEVWRGKFVSEFAEFG